MSRLAAFCEKAIEACWLAAIIMAPLFFNVYSSRVFEPDKISLVRSIALVMLAVWLIWRVESSRTATTARQPQAPSGAVERLRMTASQWSAGNPLILPILALAAAYIASTIASISPTVSFFGSYQRLQGLYTTFSYLLIFLLAASSIRSKAQVDRAISVALVVSFPIAFYGIIQHYFLDPLPWGGDVTTRVASNMGNSIFVGAYLVMVMPLALGRLLNHGNRASAELRGSSNRTVFYMAIALSFILLLAAWGLSFEFGAKKLIEANFHGALTPEMLAASLSNFNLALFVTIALVLAWWGAGRLLKKRVASYLLVGVYTLLLAFDSVTLLFTQSRGPLLGILAGLFTFSLLYSLVRRARRAAFALSGLALLVVLFLAAFNVASATPLASLRDLPYIGRLGRVLETEGGTGRVRVLIWQGALKLVLPHAPLWSPTTGEDLFNPVRPLIGYGPESMYVAFNPFYPPELGQLESRNATSDRSHNETFDALVTTGLLGFVAENIVFFMIFYFGCKWLGLVRSPRERNAFIALWYGGGAVSAIIVGLAAGWHLIGVAVPAGMIAGFFIYLVWAALTRNEDVLEARARARDLLLISLLAAILAHFVEIHFGIAIVSTRTYFWFLAALVVAVGAGRLSEDFFEPEVASVSTPEPASPNRAAGRRKRSRRAEKQAPSALPPPPAVAHISASPLLVLAFVGGLILAVMGYDYINAINVGQNGGIVNLIKVSLLAKPTTAGLQTSFAMLWLFAGTFLLLAAIAVAEWGLNLSMGLRDWIAAVVVFSALTLAIFFAFTLYHSLLIGASGRGAFDALLSSLTLFYVFVLLMVVVIALTLLFDTRLGSEQVARPTTLILAPVFALIAIALVDATNVSVVQADMIFKQAGQYSTVQTFPTGIELYRRALGLAASDVDYGRAQQDYYLLFLGRAHLEYAKVLTEAAQRETELAKAEEALLRARGINPLNTDHSANLARLHQAWAGMATGATSKEDHYKKSFSYYQDALKISPYTAHLYDQFAEAQLEYASFLGQQGKASAADEAQQAASRIVDASLRIDPTFCFTLAIRAGSRSEWSLEVRDALEALKFAPKCGDVFEAEGRGLALQTLSRAGDQAAAAGVGAQYMAMLEEAGRANPSLEVFTALANYNSKAGLTDAAIKSTEAALALIPESDKATRQKYLDFEKGLNDLKVAVDRAQAAPNDAGAQRALARAWLARGQADLAVAQYQKVLALSPEDYDSARHVVLLQLQLNQWGPARQVITLTLKIAPLAERVFWERLATALDAAQNGQAGVAATIVDDLISSVDPKDDLGLGALRTLSAKLKGSG